MNPDIQKLQEQVAELMAWKRARETQQLTAPFDDTSRLVLRAVTSAGYGTADVSEDVTISGTPETITIPKVPTGTLILQTTDGQVEIPYFT
jgi:hypothetical protein